MATKQLSKNKTSNHSGRTRLGRGLSSLMAQPVKINADADGAKSNSKAKKEPVADETLASENSNGAKETQPNSNSTSVPRGTDVEETAILDDADGLNLVYIAVEKIKENPFQPRKEMNSEALNWLAESIKSEGVMQPIVVRSGSKNGSYELVAGERRWRAAQLAGIGKVPATIHDLSDQQTAEWAIVENVQREDLNPMDRAEAFQLLSHNFSLTHEQIGKKVGLKRSSVANFFKLLDLCNAVREYIRSGHLSSSQGRVLARLSDVDAQKMIAEVAIKKAMSVKQLEAQVNSAQNARPGEQHTSQNGTANKPPSGKAEYLADLERQLAEQLSTRVRIKSGRKKGSGALTIEFYSLDEFDSLMNKLGVKME